MKQNKYEMLKEIESRWYRDIRDFEYWQNLHKKI